MRIAVTGTRGQVALALQELGPKLGAHVVALGRPELDLTKSATVEWALVAAAPDVVVSAAAYTAVDKAEYDPALAYLVNAQGAGWIAAAAGRLGVPIVHLSTDYVFAGDHPVPYREEDETRPLGVYGASKLAGEMAVAAANPNHAILRTSWVYSPFGANFVRTMLRLAEHHDVVRVVADQHGAPTSACDLASGIVVVCRNLLSCSDDGALRGVFHIAAAGSTTWAGFAEEIFAASAESGGPRARVEPIPTSEYPAAAARPANSRLNCSKLLAAHGVTLPEWPASTKACVERLVAGFAA